MEVEGTWCSVTLHRNFLKIVPFVITLSVGGGNWRFIRFCAAFGLNYSRWIGGWIFREFCTCLYRWWNRFPSYCTFGRVSMKRWRVVLFYFWFKRLYSAHFVGVLLKVNWAWLFLVHYLISEQGIFYLNRVRNFFLLCPWHLLEIPHILW